MKTGLHKVATEVKVDYRLTNRIASLYVDNVYNKKNEKEGRSGQLRLFKTAAVLIIMVISGNSLSSSIIYIF